MNKSKKIKEFFTSEIEGKLLQFEWQRKSARYGNKCIKWLMGLFALSAYLANFNLYFFIGSFVAFFLVGLILWYADANPYEYRYIFKTKIVKEIVKFVDPSWSYYPDRKIVKSHYDKLIYLPACNVLEGEDLIKGRIDKTNFEFSEIIALNETTKRGKTVKKTVFEGFLFYADFNKNFQGTTYLSPDKYESRYGEIVRKFQKNKKFDMELVEMENRAFEKAFVVRSTDQIEARYILTPKIMEALFLIKKKYNYQLSVFFKDSKVYITAENTGDFFEADLSKKGGCNYESVEKMINILRFNELVVGELNLNTRIWTKQ